MIFFIESVKDDRESVYVGILWVFLNISGLVIMLFDGIINSINENFALMFFGYFRVDLIGKVYKIKCIFFFFKVCFIFSVCNGYIESIICNLYFGVGYFDFDFRFL